MDHSLSKRLKNCIFTVYGWDIVIDQFLKILLYMFLSREISNLLYYYSFESGLRNSTTKFSVAA